VAAGVSAVVDTVIKLGGSLLGRQGALEEVIPHLESAAARGGSVVIVPGGGPFADIVRRLDHEIGLTEDAAHWMAILGMDQYAQLLVSRIAGARLVVEPSEIAPAHQSALLPVLAPYKWLQRADKLPHSWEVTSDSIAAWVAGELGARRLILVKPVIGEISALVDGYFSRALPSHIDVTMTTARDLGRSLTLTPVVASPRS
jgi:5-(aminomethyl)-3-furanmethanol phosphate kinase